MKCTLISLLAVLGPALASPTPLARDLNTIKSVLSDIQTQVTSLNTAITAKPLKADPVITQSNNLVNTINKGASTVNAQDSLNQIDALGLVSPTQDLADDTDKTIESLISIKPDVLKMGEGCTTLTALNKQHKAATDLSSAIVAKVPEALGSTAEKLSGKISASIKKGVGVYKGSCDEEA
ncbi:hypothetical protein ASPVEDRAFT_38314 [Aspergillus versicolor CBS 583.65]|uniref:Hydrophobic surface binding protein A n=1 Tax=Aspergillus versicolor CBS 583.65 TaxID=1036611 RepID=A0A1L9PBG3_ASPVE|nr:uncharacterized protein ASPVEDRAFT_38314 [Aspergillus versicolor CBS 583.65]OJI98813.1 hypothetical protein ASPVEDRAFT_38314 [Aspergillus versicolor CBS 583.65]